MRFTSLIALLLLSGVARAQPALPFGDDGWKTDWSKASVDLKELEVNVPRDGLQALDNPYFESIISADAWLQPQEPVVQIHLEGRARAYPLQVLTWHEIVNDVMGTTPITVTFCPLCYSAVAFDRRVGTAILDFGVSGMLRHSDLVMYDRQTHSLWQQLTGEALVGGQIGEVLTRIPAQIVSFAEFRHAFPEGDVLSQDTGFDRDYGRNPYAGYDNIDSRPWLFRGVPDGRLRPMEKVVGVQMEGASKAYAHEVTRRERVVNDELGGVPIVVFHTRNGATSALDGEQIAQSRVIGSTGVFSRATGDRTLTFRHRRGRFQDRETGSEWDISGRAVAGPLEGARLDPVQFVDVFAFAWFAMMPDTGLYVP